MFGRRHVWALFPTQLLGALLVMGLARGDVSSAQRQPREDTAAHDSANVHASIENSVYSDTDHVLVVSPTVALGIDDPVAGWSANGRYLVDVVSAASADIVATASPTWHEVRHVASLDGAYKPGDFGISPRLSYSSEPDYHSVGAGLSLSADLDEKAWTLALGYGYGHDTIGLGPTPFSAFSRTLDRHSLNLSASAVVDRATRITFIADGILERGELAKLYRFVPTFDPTHANVPDGASVAAINALRDNERPRENVPDARNRYALTVRLAHRFPGWTFRGDERIYADNWGLMATTTDVRCMIDISDRVTLWPHFRGHLQDAVSFWKRVYVATTDSAGVVHLPEYIAGNRELGPQHSLTLGGGVSWAMGPDENVNREKLTFSADGIGTWYSQSLFLSQRFGVFSAVTFDLLFD